MDQTITMSNLWVVVEFDVLLCQTCRKRCPRSGFRSVFFVTFSQTAKISKNLRFSLTIRKNFKNLHFFAQKNTNLDQERAGTL